MRTNDLWLSPEIAAPQNLPAIPPSLSTSFYFPPSPPYTNPTLKETVPLPCPPGCTCPAFIKEVDDSDRGMALIEEEDHGYPASASSDGSFDLITPPSSPRGSKLELSDEQGQFDTETAFPQNRPLFEEPGQEWERSSIGDDGWDDPLFLNAPTAECEPDDLLINSPPGSSLLLDPEDQQWQDSELPLDSSSDEPPPIHPSFFDVFKNDWDATPVETSQSTHSNVPSIDNSGFNQLSIQSSVQNSINPLEYSLFNDGANLFLGPRSSATFTHGESISHGLISPPSPSRRSTLSLPSNEGPAFQQNSRPGLSPPLTTSYLPDFSIPAISPLSKLTESHHMLFDVPSDIFQSPLNPSFDLPQPKSLLFAPNPEDVPLPPSPPLEIGDFSLSDSDSEELPLAFLEESRLRALRQRYAAKEQEAKARDVALTEYIARLSTMREPQPNAVYCAVPGGHMPMLLPSSPQGPSEEGLAGPGPSTFSFHQMRALEIQVAMSQRNLERAKRKRYKEKIREIASLLLYKSIHLRVPTPTGYNLANFVPNSQKLSAVAEVASRVEEEVGQDVLHIVAKMFFRRSDSPRSLATRSPPTSPPRRYVRSSLSKETLVDSDSGKDCKDCGCVDCGSQETRLLSY